ncbi:DNRLRE domain-containing protein [Streptomyces microflavus]|uniref:DNRLRE domain-containing protein n=1 Tax=Streptomyces microflavus TaxID=1919 RepID=UPI0037F318C2
MAAETALLSTATPEAIAADAVRTTTEQTAPSEGGGQAPKSVSEALLAARLENRKVEVVSEKTETSTTWALPSGEFQTSAYAAPIRVRQEDGSWDAVDTDLADAGAALEPKTAAADVTISDGGDTQLASLSKGSATFGLGWHEKLPVPTVKEDTASYDLGAGQTLAVTALSQGFSENILLQQAPAQNPVYRIPVNLKGLELSQADSGHLLLKDPKGKLVAEAPAPMMWDSSKHPVSGESEHQARVTTTIETAHDGTQSLVLKPDAAYFGQDLTYPVTVDPTSTLAVTTDTWVQNPDYPDSQVSSTELKSGTYDTGTNVARSYLKFDVSKFKGKHITDTNLALYSSYSATCSTSGAGTQVRRVTADWSSSDVTWSTQPATTTTGAVTNKAALGWNSTCPAGTVNFDVDSIVQDWAGGAANYGLQLRGADEKDATTWRRFRSANYVSGDGSSEPHLTVTYNSYPAVPVSGAIAPSQVNAYNGSRYVTSLTPTLSAKVTDPDGSKTKAQFEITPDPAHADTTYTYTAASALVASGSIASVAVPSATAFPAGSHLRYRVRANDGTDDGPWSAYSTFVLNTGKPTAPSITCATYEAGTWTAKAGAAVDCTLDTDSTDGAGYHWGLDDPGMTKRSLDTTNGSGGDKQTISISPADGWHTLHARTVDSGGNLSTATTAYSFGVGTDGAALLAPGDGDRPARRVGLAATGKSTYTGVTYQYRRGETDSWHNVPLAAVTKNADGSAVASWPITSPNGSAPALTWNITTSLAEDGPVDLRAAFTDGQSTGYSQPNTVTVDRVAGDAPMESVGPGQVNDLTGDFGLQATDASSHGMSVTRSASSRTPQAAANAEGQAAIFGPQWTSGTLAEATESDWAYIRKTSATSLAVVDANGGQTGFTALSAGGWKPEPGSERLTLTGNLTGVLTLNETEGTTTTFKKIDPAATTWQVSSSYRPADNTTINVVSEKVVTGGKTLARPRYVIAPTSATTAATCETTPSTKGCRVLEYEYATSSTASGTTLGDFTGQVKQIKSWSTTPQASTSTATPIAAYVYDASGRLREAWDPRTSPALKTTYTYDTSGRVLTQTPPGELPWTFAYGSVGTTTTAGPGMLLSASRPTLKQGTTSETDGTATTSVVYNIPLNGPKAPYAMGPADVAAWGQTDVPTDATAVFTAAAVPASHEGPSLNASDYANAAITYTDASGRQVNSAAPGGHINAAEYDHAGNAVRQLSATNRALALGSTDTTRQRLALLGLDQLSIADRAEQLSTTMEYSTDGQRLLEELGPLHPVTLERNLAAAAGGNPLTAGTEIPARQHIVHHYDEGRPGTAAVSNQETSTVTGAYIEGYPADADVRKTATTYDWATGLPTATVDDPGGLNITTTTKYDTSGRVIKTIRPMSNGTDAGATVTSYWSSGGTGPCSGRPEWADLLCSIAPAGAITGSGTNPDRALTTTTEYDRWGNPTKVTRSANGTTDVTTTTYDAAGRLTRTSVTGGIGTAVTDIVTTYDAATGKTSTVSSNGKTVTHEYDRLGREVSYQDGAGNTAAHQYDALDRPVKVTDSAPSTTTYAYDTTKDPRGLTTSITDSIAGTTTGAYDADGNLITQSLPGGYRLDISRNESDNETSRVYTQTSTGTVPLSDTAALTVHGDQAGHTLTTGTSTTSNYKYDGAGRRTEVTDTVDTECTRQSSSYNANGVVVSQTSANAPCETITTAPAETRTFSYDSADRPVDTGYAYDALSRWTTQPGGSAQTYYTGDQVRDETTPTQRKTWDLDAAGRSSSWTTETKKDDGTWTAPLRTTNHYRTGGDDPAWSREGADKITRNVQDLEERVSLTTSAAGNTMVQFTDLTGASAVQLPTTPLLRSAIGSTALGVFEYTVGGYTMKIPSGCFLTHKITGKRRSITYQMASTDCVGVAALASFCNWRMDFAYADTSNRTYKTLKGAVHVTCKRGGGTTRKIEKNRTLAHYGKACAKLYVNGSRRATQCHYITK